MYPDQSLMQSKADRTRQFILEKTAPVFNKNGFEGTSLTDLLKTTGLTKGALYGNFRDKEDIAAEAFRYSMAKVRAIAGDRIKDGMSAKQKIMALVTFFSHYVFNPPIAGGCPMLNTAVESDDAHTSMKKVVASEIDRTITFIARLIQEGKRNAEFHKNTRSRDIAYILFASIEGALMISRVSSSDAAMKAVVRHCKTLLDRITI